LLLYDFVLHPEKGASNLATGKRGVLRCRTNCGKGESRVIKKKKRKRGGRKTV